MLKVIEHRKDFVGKASSHAVSHSLHAYVYVYRYYIHILLYMDIDSYYVWVMYSRYTVCVIFLVWCFP